MFPRIAEQNLDANATITMTSTERLLNAGASDPVLRAFLFHASVLLAKTMLMSPLTSRMRVIKGVFSSPEDLVRPGNRLGYDEDVERLRRAHLNDLENIPIFILTGFVYILTKPIPRVAIVLFRIFTLSRFLHTYVYAIRVHRPPLRTLAWGIGFLINWYMALAAMAVFIVD